MDHARVESLYRTYGSLVLRRARGILGNEDDAREVLQEVFLSLVRHPVQFRGDSSPLTWLYSATTHCCLNRVRNARTRLGHLEARGQVESEARGPTAEHSVVVRDLLGKLPEDHAKAAIYFFLDEMTYDEIAQTMGCSRRHIGHLLEEVRGRLGVREEEMP